MAIFSDSDRNWGAYFKEESQNRRRTITFALLQAQLIYCARAEIQNGRFTERGLARILGISQPQLHNVLKGERKLRPQLADLLLDKLRIDVVDLIANVELARSPEYSGVEACADDGSPPVCRFDKSETSLPRKPVAREHIGNTRMSGKPADVSN